MTCSPVFPSLIDALGTGRPLRDHEEEENRSVMVCSPSPSPSVIPPSPTLTMAPTISMPTPLPRAVRPVLGYENDVDLSSVFSFHYPLHSSWPSFYSHVRSFFLSSLSHTAPSSGAYTDCLLTSHDSAYDNAYGHSCTHLLCHFAS